MAQMHPTQPDWTTPISERKVFARLRDGLPDDWIVLHARRIVLPGRLGDRAFEGELDFLVLNPHWGWLGLEVKGGDVRRTASGWISRDHAGTDHHILDPGKQVQSAVRAVRKYLGNHPEARHWAEKIPFGWGVVLPDVAVPGDLGLELPRAFIVDSRDLDRPREALERVSNASGRGMSLPRDVQRKFVEVLAPPVRLVRSLAGRVQEDDTALVRLTDEQLHILETLFEFSRIAVKGPAGTGKTVVAMEKARRLAAEGKKVLLLCYNRHLADYLAARADGFMVKNFYALCRDFASAARIPFAPPSDSRCSP